MTAPNDQDFYVSGLFDLSKYAFARTDIDYRWDNFVEQSPQGTVYAKSAFLSALNANLGAWKCLKNGEWVASIITGEKDRGKTSCSIPFSIYGGILIRQASERMTLTSVRAEEFSIVAASIMHLTSTYDNVNLSLSPHLTDMRPFLWHNYGERKTRFNLELKYTSYIDLSSVTGETDYHNDKLYFGLSKSRRQEIRYGIQRGVSTIPHFDLDKFQQLYKMTFERQNIPVEREEIRLIIEICSSLYKANQLKMFGTFTDCGALASMFAFGIDDKRAYFLFGANNPELRASLSGTVGLYQSIRLLAQEKVSAVDLEGVNSPKRGYFKLSFGGNLLPYYRVSI